jgi:hypothetical protein
MSAKHGEGQVISVPGAQDEEYSYDAINSNSEKDQQLKGVGASADMFVIFMFFINLTENLRNKTWKVPKMYTWGANNIYFRESAVSLLLGKLYGGRNTFRIL